MPAPTAAQMRAQAELLYGQSFGAEGKQYMELLFSKISEAWDTWQKSITWGALEVAGAGSGGWAGVGEGGQMAGSPFILEPFSFANNSPEQLKFTQALADALKEKMSPFPATYEFILVNYAGDCGATGPSPGPVDALNIPMPLLTAGKGQNPSGIANLWKSMLTPPMFDLGNPNAKSGGLIDAIGKTIEQSFQAVWLTTTMASTNSVKCMGAPGGVVAGFPSALDGKLV